MMNFLRHHQRKLLIVISVMTIASFLFFGTFSTFSANEQAPDKEIAKALDGSPIMEREVRGMVHFFSYGNSSVIQRELFATGIATILAEKHFAAIQEEFQERLEKVKRYRPYAHPQTPFLSAEAVWGRFMPTLNTGLAAVKNSAVEPKSFALYSKLYLDQTAFPPALLRQVLLYQQRQFQGVQSDPLMTEERLGVSGFHSLEEWFGPKFMQEVCRFVVNASMVAEKRGYKITASEVRADLLQNALKALQAQGHREEVNYQDAEQFLHYQLRLCGLDEGSALKMWKKVMLFSRLFEDVGQAVFLDPLTYEQFAAYADETASIDLYAFPQYDLSKLQAYLDAVAPKNRQAADPFAAEMISAEELEKKFPELVHSRFTLEVAQVAKEELTSKVSLKETWEWEQSDAGWSGLVEAFPMVKRKEGQERFLALESIESKERLKIDQFARERIVATHPEWVAAAFQNKKMEKLSVGIRSKGAVHPFTDVENSSDLLAFLRTQGEGDFTSRGGTIYRIKVLEKPLSKEIMTFQEAVDHLSKTEGETALPKRLAARMEIVRKSIQALGQDSPYLKASGSRLKDQWLITRRVLNIKRSEETNLPKEELFSAAKGHWSPVATLSNGEMVFFHLNERKVSQEAMQEKIDEGKMLLSMDAKRLLMHQIVSE